MPATWTRENLAWLAGLFEGEGCISTHQGKTGRAYWILQIQMTDEDVVRRAAEVAGAGMVTGPYSSRRENRKPQWAWRACKRGDVYALLVALWPWLRTRRRARAREALLALPPVIRKGCRPCV